MQDVAGMEVRREGGVAVREVVMAPGHGRADYLLHVDRRVRTPGGLGRQPVDRTASVDRHAPPSEHRA